MNPLNRARLLGAVARYDLWMDLRGVPRKRRRELRRELRTNLAEAAEHRGARAALDRLGSTRRLAAEGNPVDPARPRWSVGGSVAATVLGLVVLAEMLSVLAWADGALAAAPDSVVTGTLTFFPGTGLEYDGAGDGFAMTWQLGWLAPAAALLAFVLVARPWRQLTGGRRAVARQSAA